MRVVDLSSDPSIEAVVALLREVTRASSSSAALSSFARNYRSVRPMDAYVGVRPVHGAPGAYRVLYTHVADRPEADLPGPASEEDADRLPIRHGGLVANLINHEGPRMVSDLGHGQDPVLGTLPPDIRTCFVLPLFQGERVQDWALAFSRRAPEEFSAEDLSRALMTGNLFALANRHLDSYATISRLNASLRDQFDQVARVQQQLLPLRTPEIPGLEIATSYIPSELAGGDYYDFFRLPGGAWGILVADVSGHGAAAATIMAMLHAILHAYAPISEGDKAPNPADVLEFANARLCDANLEGAFVTAIFGVYLPAIGHFTFANAGHPPPRLKRGLDGSLASVDSDASVPLGIHRPLDARSASVILEPRDTIILYTDGVTEAFSPTREMFGVQRLDDALTRCTGQPDCVVESVHRALFEHRGNPTRDDDQTLVALRFDPATRRG